MEDTIYTMALFIIEPNDWCARYDWRPLSELEQTARFVWWREIAARMGVPPALIPTSLPELRDWVESHESQNMFYVPTNGLCASSTRDLLLRSLPKWAQPIGMHAVSALLTDRVRLAMGFDEAPEGYRVWIPRILRMRALFIKRLMLPRWRPFGYGISEVEGDPGRFTRTYWKFEPWYVRQTFGTYLSGLLSITPSAKYRSEGFRHEQLGPEDLREKGNQQVLQAADKMRQQSAGGKCPFWTPQTDSLLPKPT